MKKIIFCINSLEMGGAEKVLVDLVLALKEEKKYDIEVLTTKENNTYLSNIIKTNIKYDYLISDKDMQILNKIPILNKGLISFFKRIKLKKIVRDKDIIVDFLDGDFEKYIKNIKDKKKICWLHLSYDILKTRKKNIDAKLLAYDNVVVICNEIKDEIQMKNPELYKKLSVIYNLFDFKNKIEASFEEFTKEEKKYVETKYFLTVCRLDESQKDVKTLIQAYSKYKGKSKLYIIGKGESEKELKELVEKLKLEEKIIFLGEKKNPYKWMKNCEAFILSTKTEGLPTVLIEALAMEAKVISAKCKTGPKEILENGKLGELFEVGNCKELEGILNKIENKEFNKNDIKESLERFEKRNIIKKLNILFQS